MLILNALVFIRERKCRSVGWINHGLRCVSILGPGRKTCHPWNSSLGKMLLQITQIIGIILIRLPLMNRSHLQLRIHVFDLYISLIIGLGILKIILCWSITLINPFNTAIRNTVDLSRSFYRGHVFLEWNHHSILFTRSELTRIHLHFMHPAAYCLFYLIKWANPANATDSVKELVDELTAACLSRKEYKSRPLRFKVNITPSKLVFNQSVSIDILSLEEKMALHVVDGHNNYRNAIIVRSEKGRSRMVVLRFLLGKHVCRPPQSNSPRPRIWSGIEDVQGPVNCSRNSLIIHGSVIAQLDGTNGKGTHSSPTNILDVIW